VDGSLVVRRSEAGFPEVLAALRDEVRRRGIREFALIDHAEGARDAGLELADESVLVFGNPAVGTALMLADPLSGLDLPLRVLVHRAADGGTVLAYHDPRALAEAFALGDAAGTAAALARVLDEIVTAAAG
jgi:uncharacterized protein (DUF302 family)